MQEYITGRVKLSECDSKKAVKEIQNANKELVFVQDKEKNIIVDEVPAVYGVRCGAVVSGFMQPGSKKLKTVQWPSGSLKSCKLSQLMKANKISKKDDVLVFKTDVVYCTHIVKVDTKDFGLPQTRLRTVSIITVIRFWSTHSGNIFGSLYLIFSFLSFTVHAGLATGRG
jgi:hypothetical protein